LTEHTTGSGNPFFRLPGSVETYLGRSKISYNSIHSYLQWYENHKKNLLRSARDIVEKMVRFCIEIRCTVVNFLTVFFTNA